MAKEFNPDDFLNETAVIAESQRDIERRNAEKTAAGQEPMTAQQQQQAAMSPSGGPIAPTNPPGTLENMAANVYGVVKPAVDIGGAVLSNPVVQTGLELAGGGLAAKKFLVNPVLDALKPVGQAVGQQVNNVTNALTRQAAAAEAHEAGVASRAAARAAQVAPKGPIAPTYNVPTSSMPQARMPVPNGPVAPTIQSRMQAAAAQRVLPVAAVPAAVAAGGAAATGFAGNQLANMTPEQRKAYYDSMMMGAMSGDTGFAAAIMNRGQ